MISSNRKEFIKETVINCLIETNTHRLPIQIEHIIFTYSNIRLIKYSVFMSYYNVTLSEIINGYDSYDGVSFYSAAWDKFIILYNDVSDNLITSNRYRWTLSHELGHILLGHHLDIKTRLKRNSLSEEEYKAYEEEGDYFAQLLLVPHACLCNFVIKKPKHIEIMCQLSGVASSRRFKQFVSWKSRKPQKDNFDNAIFDIFYDFSFKRKCKSCNHITIQRHGKYCIFCGKKSLDWSNEDVMKYPRPTTHDNNKLLKCHICGNDETEIKGEYCQICGARLVNYCSNKSCNNQLPSNARYCPLCGEESIFNTQGILREWQEDKEIYDFDDIEPFN